MRGGSGLFFEGAADDFGNLFIAHRARASAARGFP